MKICKRTGLAKVVSNPTTRQKVEQRIRELGSLGLPDVHARQLSKAAIAREYTDERIEKLLAQVADKNPRRRGAIWNPGPGGEEWRG